MKFSNDSLCGVLIAAAGVHWSVKDVVKAICSRVVDNILALLDYDDHLNICTLLGKKSTFFDRME